MTAFSQERLRAIHVIEALRSGVPTRLSTRALADLRPGVTRAVRADLEAIAAGERQPGRIVWGEYGQGKSHFLTVIEHLALDRGFAVSRASLSREVTCHHLFNFYRHVAPQLRVSDSLVPGLERQLAKLDVARLDTSPIQAPERYPHALPASVVQALIHAQVADAPHHLYHDLVGSRLPIAEVRRAIQEAGMPELLPKLSRFKVGEHAPAYFGVMADTVRLCGYQGWLILIDEVELIGRLGKVSRMQAYRNLHWLLNWSDAMPYPIYVVGAAATSLQQLWTQERGRFAPDQVVIPELAESRAGAAAGAELQRFFRIALDPQRSLTLEWIDRGTVQEMLQKVGALHGVAHGWAAPQDAAWARQITAHLKDDTKLRTWIRLALEALDLQLITGAPPTIEPAPLCEPLIEGQADPGRPVADDDPDGPFA